MEPKDKPSIPEGMKSTVEIRSKDKDNGETLFKVSWRGICEVSDSLSEALRALADSIEEYQEE